MLRAAAGARLALLPSPLPSRRFVSGASETHCRCHRSHAALVRSRNNIGNNIGSGRPLLPRQRTGAWTQSASMGTASSSSKRAKRPRNRARPKPQQQQEHQQHHSSNEPRPPRWPAAASAAIAPLMFAAWWASDQAFGNRTRGQNEDLRAGLLAELRERGHVQTGGGSGDHPVDWSSLGARPVLFWCVVRKASGVAHCLPGVELGDVVEVLEEGVGPGREYNLCRLPAVDGPPGSRPPVDAYGWFPIRWLQTMDSYESMVRKQLVHLAKEGRPE